MDLDDAAIDLLYERAFQAELTSLDIVIDVKQRLREFYLAAGISMPAPSGDDDMPHP